MQNSETKLDDFQTAMQSRSFCNLGIGRYGILLRQFHLRELNTTGQRLELHRFLELRGKSLTVVMVRVWEVLA